MTESLNESKLQEELIGKTIAEVEKKEDWLHLRFDDGAELRVRIEHDRQACPFCAGCKNYEPTGTSA